ncbi:hypothetical protein LCGC14_2828230 [marine sediment metagenome]|uniref:Uncharacterized protein n=1 Tax=marine sediment metagenome TaxID=412755 RepID=A0A0F8Z1P3_9ZZZZ
MTDEEASLLYLVQDDSTDVLDATESSRYRLPPIKNKKTEGRTIGFSSGYRRYETRDSPKMSATKQIVRLSSVVGSLFVVALMYFSTVMGYFYLPPFIISTLLIFQILYVDFYLLYISWDLNLSSSRSFFTCISPFLVSFAAYYMVYSGWYLWSAVIPLIILFSSIILYWNQERESKVTEISVTFLVRNDQVLI